jgi:hypothetical protein
MSPLHAKPPSSSRAGSPSRCASASASGSRPGATTAKQSSRLGGAGIAAGFRTEFGPGFCAVDAGCVFRTFGAGFEVGCFEVGFFEVGFPVCLGLMSLRRVVTRQG